MNFYFTFGTDEDQSFYGGWVKIIAEDKDQAYEKFRKCFPDREQGTLNCAFVYTEDEFKKTKMPIRGNYGFKCHEIIE